MCLTAITRIIKEPTMNEVEVWKAYNVGPEGELLSPYYSPTIVEPQSVIHRFHGIPMSARITPMGVWLRATDEMLKVEFDVTFYPSGFHGFVENYDARMWGFSHCNRHSTTIRRVKFRQVVAEGTQDKAVVLVAKEMFVMKEGV